MARCRWYPTDALLSRKPKEVEDGMRARQVHLILGVVLAVAIFSAAAGAAPAVYQDGTYVAVSDADDHGYLMAIVTIKDGKIAQVRLTEMNGFGAPKPASYPWEPYHEAMKVLPGRFVEANDWDVDIVTQATGTSESARQAVQRALEKAAKVPGGKNFDGTFFGRSAADDHGYDTALVTIKDDRIVAGTLGEVQADGTWKDFSTYPWEPTDKGKEQMEQAFVAANGVEVDLITGSTSSSKKWIQAVTNALKAAER